jgi:hypothetical protein
MRLAEGEEAMSAEEPVREQRPLLDNDHVAHGYMPEGQQGASHDDAASDRMRSEGSSHRAPRHGTVSGT